jgi:GntR family transcriptional regulator, transcriptional repressor for pyruvate dehydrogenase complex
MRPGSDITDVLNPTADNGLGLPHPPVYQSVADRLRHAIHIGAYLPGDLLPSERVLAEQAGVSRVTIREAVRVLQAEGYLATRRGARGGPVLLANAEAVEVVIARLRQREEEFEALFEFREVIECAAARLAASRRTDEDIARARSAIEDMRLSEDIATFRRADSLFHLALADASRNRRIRDAVEESRDVMFLALDAIDLTLTKATSVPHHKRILKAVVARQPEAASRAMAGHIENTRTAFHVLLDGGS